MKFVDLTIKEIFPLLFLEKKFLYEKIAWTPTFFLEYHFLKSLETAKVQKELLSAVK